MNKLRLDLPRVKRWVPLLALAVLALAYAAMREAPTVMTAVATRELPVYNVDTEEKVLSISFDAAWGCANTEGILDILDRYDVKTTFSWSASGRKSTRSLSPSWLQGGMRSATIRRRIRTCRS